MEAQRHPFLTSTSGEASSPNRFAPGDSPGTHRLGGSVGSKVSLDADGKRTNLLPLPEIETRSSRP
jgi:hypothetical protein